MKRILFVGQSLKIGGVEKALVEQLNSLDKEKYSVDLFLFSPTGSYFNELSPAIHILNSPFVLKCAALTNAESKKSLWTFIVRTFLYVISKLVGNKRLYRFIFSGIKTLKGYDVAISYFHDAGIKGLYYGCNLFVLNKVEASLKIAWIHSDYSRISAYTEESNNIYSSFDKIVNVSFAMKAKFDSLNIVPDNKSHVVYNVINTKGIQTKAGNVLLQKETFSIITIGRLEEGKGTVQLFELANEMHQKGVAFNWVFVGSGVLENWCERFIEENNLRGVITLKGQIENPYPLIKQSALLVSGSFSETFGLSIIESLTLGTPVVALRYDAIDEVLNDSNGIVVNNFIEMRESVERMITNHSFYDCIRENTKLLFDYERLNKEQMQKLLS